MSDFCHVADARCVAPAGYRVGSSGLMDGDAKTRKVCFSCGQPVCGECSEIRPHHGRKRRLCNDCVGEVTK